MILKDVGCSVRDDPSAQSQARIAGRCTDGDG